MRDIETQPVCTETPTATPCCKCAAYREIITEQIEEISKNKLIIKDALEWAEIISSRLKTVLGVKK